MLFIKKFIDYQNPVCYHARDYLKGGGMLLVTEPSKRLAYCPVQKSGSTTWMTAFAEMNLIDGRENRSPWGLRKTYFQLIRQEYSIYAGTYQDMDKLNNLPSLRFLFVRHPFYRLASCYQMINDEKKFLRIIGNYQLYHMNLEGNELAYTKSFISFSTFVEFILHEAQNKNASFDSISNYSPEAIHWWPYTELCGVCRVHYDLVGHMETFNDDLQHLIEKFPDIEVLKEIKEDEYVQSVNWHGYKGNRTDYMDFFRQVKRVDTEKLYNRFKNDFEFGGYDYPYDFIEAGLE